MNYKMLTYAVKTQEGIQYVAEYPALRFCTGSGTTLEEAIRVLNEEAKQTLDALRLLKKPIPVSDLFEDPNAYSGKLVLRVSKTLHHRMAMRAKNEGMSLNAYMIEALSAYTYGLDQKIETPMKINLQVHE